MNQNNCSTEVIETPLGTLTISVPNLEFLREITPIEQYKIDLYQYFRSRKSANPDCEISVTDVITVPIKMTADGKSFLPVNNEDYAVIAMEVNAFMDLTVQLSDSLDEESLMRNGDPRSYGQLAQINLTKSNYSDALRYAFLGAKNGDIYSLVILGVMYSEGRGIDIDIDKAKKLYMSAALYGNHHALCNLGLLLIHSHDSDIELAQKLFERAALQGNIFAAHNLGTSLLESGNPKNIEKGLAWLKSSAEWGYELSYIALMKYFKFNNDYKSYTEILNAGVSQGFTSCEMEQIYYNANKQDESPYQWSDGNSLV